MDSIILPKQRTIQIAYKKIIHKRIQSIDLLRGIVMIVMALDHVRDYFHHSAFLSSPTDLSQTTPALFFTRWITHFCAPVFVFLAGISACLYGAKKGNEALCVFLLTRGLWLVLVEMFIVTLGWTFNPTYPFFNLQVIWATGISMIFLAAIIYVHPRVILAIALILVSAHNLLDSIHIPGHGAASFLWSLLHEPGFYNYGRVSILVRYPLLPWMGIIALGYSAGKLYLPGVNGRERRRILFFAGYAAIILFLVLRATNWYGDAANWAVQRTPVMSVLSFLNVTKYPPSLLYVLMTLGPALIFLSVAEAIENKWASRIAVFGGVPMFYYLLHILLIHLLAMIAAKLSGYHWSDMVLSTKVNVAPQLTGYGFSLWTVYAVWMAVVLSLYPACKWYHHYKKTHQSTKWWLSYL